jgi:hypothetical protein
LNIDRDVAEATETPNKVAAVVTDATAKAFQR